MSPMRVARLALALGFSTVCAAPQALQLAPAPTVQYVTVATAASASSATAGSAITLWADVTPKPRVHVYAAGATDFTPVSIVITPNAGLTVGKPTFPKPDLATAQGSTGNVPAYARPFRIAQPVSIVPGAKPGDRLTVAGAVRYQACDDRLCYPATAVPVTWTIVVK